MELIHSNVAGPMKTPTMEEGHKYVINFIDDFSHHIAAFTIARKSNALDKLKEYISLFEAPAMLIYEQPATAEGPTRMLGGFRTDGGGEYNLKEFSCYCKKKEIKRQVTIPHMPEQNRVAERD